jgi:diguanylate cyclase (GGDEF)-like protein
VGLPDRNAGGAVWRLVTLWCGVLVLFAVLPVGGRVWLLAVGSATGSGLTVLGIRRHRPHQRTIWLLLAGALAAVTAGDVLQALARAITWYSSVFFLIGYLPAGAALWKLGGSDRRPRQYAWIDSTIVLVAVAVLDWQFLISPPVSRHLGALGIVYAAVQPGVDLLILALLLRLLTGRTQRVTAFWLLLAGAAATLGSDMAVSLMTLHHRYHPGTWPDGLVLVFDAMVSIAALHPSMRDLGNTGPERRGSMMNGLAALMPAGGVVPTLMIADSAGALRLSTGVGAAASIALFGLAMLRALLVVHSSEQLASVDALTGLPNRRAFQLSLGELLADPEATPAAAVGFLDLDDFKAVNDTYGHAVGDVLIRAVAERLRGVVVDADIVARFGGDEFGLLLRGHSGTDAHAVADAVVACLCRPFAVEGLSLHIGASVGLVSDLIAADPERVMSDADVAMYTSKRHGGGHVAVFSPGMRDELLGPARLMTELAAALRSDDGGGLWVAFQPVVSVATGAIDGCEALVRWTHPTRGALAPDAFVPLAEHHGLAALIDAFVLRRSLAQCRTWEAADPRLGGLRISVNLSAESLGRNDLAEFVLHELDLARISPDRLVLEITEHSELADDTEAEAALATLAQAGVMIALDDFGTGYTAALYFERFPIRSVKLDRSIIATLADGRVSAVVRGLGALAASLDLVVLAEGVETQGQLAPLRELGFALAQGWYFARPGHPDDVVRYAREHGMVHIDRPLPRLLRETPAA